MMRVLQGADTNAPAVKAASSPEKGQWHRYSADATKISRSGQRSSRVGIGHITALASGYATVGADQDPDTGGMYFVCTGMTWGQTRNALISGLSSRK